MQLSGKSKGGGNTSYQHQKLVSLNGIVRQTQLRHRHNTPNDIKVCSDSTDKPSIESEPTKQEHSNDRAPSYTSGELADSSSRTIEPDASPANDDHVEANEDKMEVSENSSLEGNKCNEGLENHVGSAEQYKGEAERSQEASELKGERVGVNGEVVKDEGKEEGRDLSEEHMDTSGNETEMKQVVKEDEKEKKEPTAEGDLADEKHTMDASGDETEPGNGDEEDRRPRGYEPGFGKSISVYTRMCTLHTHTHTVPDLALLSEQMIRLLAMQRIQHLFTECRGGDKLPLEATGTKLNLNGMKQLVQPVQPVLQPTKQVNHSPTAGMVCCCHEVYTCI